MFSLKEVWRKLELACSFSDAKDVLYLLIHNKLPIRERLFRIGLSNDPYCEFCLPLSGASPNDREHFFCSCERVKEVWTVVRKIIDNLLPIQHRHIANVDLILLNFPKLTRDRELVWFLGSYLTEVWLESAISEGRPAGQTAGGEADNRTSKY